VNHQNANFFAVIPARYDSQRLPGKMCLHVAGAPLVAWAVAAAHRSQAQEVFVATDDQRIVETLEPFSARVLLTSVEHQSGSDRLAEVADQMAWSDDVIVVNVQGDEPALPPVLINQVAELLIAEPKAGVASLYAPILTESEFMDPNAVKVVFDAQGFALYFSRSPIPMHRQAQPQPAIWGYRHIGLYAYRVSALRAHRAHQPSALESAERLEQLRFLTHQVPIVMGLAHEMPAAGVDTAEDLNRLQSVLSTWPSEWRP
jgi:3-deoxy-manno-octulosonate cytidylyltransferase (CMP-KDO synthetase)